MTLEKEMKEIKLKRSLLFISVGASGRGMATTLVSVGVDIGTTSVKVCVLETSPQDPASAVHVP